MTNDDTPPPVPCAPGMWFCCKWEDGSTSAYPIVALVRCASCSDLWEAAYLDNDGFLVPVASEEHEANWSVVPEARLQPALAALEPWKRTK